MTYNVTRYGATGDGTAIDTNAFQSAIDECTAAGGGTVRVPAGEYLIGTIELNDGIRLSLNAGATLVASTDPEDYHNGGTPMTSLIVASEAKNVSITGQGTIDAQGLEFMNLDDTFIPAHDEAAMTTEHNARQGEDYLTDKWGTEDGPLHPLEWRPDRVVYVDRCEDVLMRDVTFRNAPNWTIHLLGCVDVFIDGLNLYTDLRIPNSDGINPDLCKNTHISNCTVVTGDDAICPKATSGLGSEQPLENLTVTNCVLVSRSSAIKFGSATNYDMRNCVFDNIVIRGSNRGIGIQHRDKGSIENLHFSNITIETKLHTGHWWGKAEPIWVTSIPRHDDHEIGSVQNIRFSNIAAQGEGGIIVHGDNESILENIIFENISLNITDSPKAAASGGNMDLRPTSTFPPVFEYDVPGLFGKHARDIDIESFELSWDNDVPGYCSYAIECEATTNLLIDDFEGRQSSNASQDAAISLTGCDGITIRNSRATSGTETFLTAENLSDERLFVNNDLGDARVAIDGETSFVKSGNLLPSRSD